MGYEHHFEFSVLIAVLALGALLYTVRMDFETAVLSVGIFVMYWALSSLYFLFVDHRIETGRFAMVTGTVFLFLFICLLAFLSKSSAMDIVLGILVSIGILLFPLSHSLVPTHDLKQLAKAPPVQHAHFIPFSSCYRLDVGFPNPLYVRDVPGHKTLEFSFYLKHEPRTYKIVESDLVHGVSKDGLRVSLQVARAKVRQSPKRVLGIVQRIANHL